jgi:type II secretory pathway pseudopilin PulG
VIPRSWVPYGGLQGGGVPGLRRRSRRSVPAFTIVEATIATLVVAVMFVVALNTVGASRLTQYRASQVSRGRLLAESLCAEILRQDYQDPDGTPIFGREADESAVTRAAWDDVDDYEGLSESPPVARDGTVLADTAGWKRTVQVEWVDAADPRQTETTETNVKRITVTALYGNVPQAVLVVLRADN